MENLHIIFVNLFTRAAVLIFSPEPTAHNSYTMFMTKAAKKRMLAEFLPILFPATEQKMRSVKVTGTHLLLSGWLADANNKPIVKDKLYDLWQTAEVPVNHTKRLLQLVKDAANQQEMEDMLAKYVADFGDPSYFLSSQDN